MVNLTSIKHTFFRSKSLRLVLLAFVCWLGATSAAYFGYQVAADWLAAAFFIFGFFGALVWVAYCIIAGLLWLRARGPT